VIIIQRGERYFTVKQIADQMQVHPRFILQEIKSGALPAIRINARGDFRIHETAFADWLANREEH